jgi:hypothetical protein
MGSPAAGNLRCRTIADTVKPRNKLCPITFFADSCGFARQPTLGIRP